jgi:general secretion pathway protein F
MRTLVDALERRMREGDTFSTALAEHPRVFSGLFLSAIRAGEAAGKLDDILARLVAFDDQQEDLESRLRGALAYPILLLVLGLGCLAFFIWGVVPRMRTLFDSMGGQLPWPTRFLIQCSEFLSSSWGWVIAGAVLAVAACRALARVPAVIEAAEQLMLFVPGLREIVQARYISRFTRTLQLLLHSGLPVFQAIDVARPTLGSARLERRMQDAHDLLKRGETIAESLRAARCFPPLVIHMVAVGESAGTLVDVLDELATYYERQLDETLRITTALLEPAMIVLMGLLVGFCVLAMILPVFQMTQLVR